MGFFRYSNTFSMVEFDICRTLKGQIEDKKIFPWVGLEPTKVSYLQGRNREIFRSFFWFKWKKQKVLLKTPPKGQFEVNWPLDFHHLCRDITSGVTGVTVPKFLGTLTVSYEKKNPRRSKRCHFRNVCLFYFFSPRLWSVQDWFLERKLVSNKSKTSQAEARHERELQGYQSTKTKSV